GQAQTDKERIEELERKVDLLSKGVERSVIGDVVTEIGEGMFGLGPAASKIYHAKGGVSIGGYGEAVYTSKDDGPNEADFLRGVLYFGYKYNEKWVFNSEFEFEHGSTSEEGSASVEFAYLDYLHSPELNFRAGLLLVPVGLINELHEPTSFLSARRPDVENRIIPSTWRENGVGIFGTLNDFIDYKAYLVNGLRGERFSGKGLRGGRQKGSEAKADDLAGVIRIDLNPNPGLIIGGSAYFGDSGQDIGIGVGTEIYEAHIDYQAHGWSVRALGTVANVDDVAELNRFRAAAAASDGMVPADSEIDSVGEELVGWYVEVGYDLLNSVESGEKSITPYVRYEEYNTQEDTPAGFKTSAKYDVEVITVGVNYKPIDEIVFKADYQFYDDEADSVSDQFNLSMGYVF
ncbi:MAG: hypothetical protein AAF492_12795, partial [Verrucomicrobiota bacterium]